MKLDELARRWQPRRPRRRVPFATRLPRQLLVIGSLCCLAGASAPFGAAAGVNRLPAASPLGQGPIAQARYRAPLPGPLVVLRRFEPPPTAYAAGHRGVDLAAPRQAAVVAAAAGRVTFAGQVAGRGLVVIAHPDGIRTEYEPIRPVVVAGQAVTSGQLLGRLSGTHGRQPPDRCLHWGARRADTYVDPMSLLRALGPVRLLPWPGPGQAVAEARPAGAVPPGPGPGLGLGLGLTPGRAGAGAGSGAGTVPDGTGTNAGRPGPYRPGLGLGLGTNASRSGPRVGARVGPAQPVDGHVGVDLRRGEARVAE
jgi:hypothetical protein